MTVYESLEGKVFWQVLSVGIPGLASLVVTSVFLCYVLWKHVKHYVPLVLSRLSSEVGVVSVDGGRLSRRPSERIEENNSKPSSLSHMQSQFGLLFINLVIADFLQALAFSLNWHWVVVRRAPQMHSHQGICSLQGALINVGDVACALWSLAIACHTLTFLVLKRKPPIWVIYGTIGFIWTFNVLLAVIGPIHANAIDGPSFFAWTRVWCFISSDYEEFRLWLHYLWILICLFVIVIIYVVIHAYLVVHDRRTTSALGVSHNSATVRIARRMLLYPLSYACVVLPITSVRLTSISGSTPSEGAQTFAGCCLALAGLVDCVLYITTRNVIFRDPSKKESSGATRSKNPAQRLSTVSKGQNGAILVTRECVTSYDVDLDPLKPGLDRKLSSMNKSTCSDIAEEGDRDSADDYHPSADLHPHLAMHQSPLSSMNIDEQIGHVRQQQDQRASVDFGAPPSPDMEKGQARRSFGR